MSSSEPMSGKTHKSGQWVIGAVGQKLFQEDLPAPGGVHWTPRRKADVVAAISGGLFTVSDVMARYSLTIEELSGWRRAFDKYGMAGLRATHAQKYRDRAERAQQMGWAAQS